MANVKKPTSLVGVFILVAFALAGCAANQQVSNTHSPSPNQHVISSPAPIPSSTSSSESLNQISQDLDGANGAAAQSGDDTNSGDSAAATQDNG
jgi:uncharacterized protein YcfL